MKRTTTSLLLTGALVLTLGSIPAVQAATTADAPWSGYRLSKTADSAATWLGGRTASGQVVYRIDPARPRQVTAGLGKAGWETTLKGSGTRQVSRTDTSRAAWILSKYGTYRYAVQNAAVEIALNELLHGGRWSLSGAATRQRLAQTPQASKIRSFAATMLADSARFAGPYEVTATPTPLAAAGGFTLLTVAVRSARTGAAIANLPVTVTYDGTRVENLITGSDGTVTTDLPAGVAGTRTATAVVGLVPEDRLSVRGPTTSGASRVVVAGIKRSITATATIPVRAVPKAVTTSSTATILTTQSAAGTLTISGSSAGSRQATVGLFGPFETAASVSCASTKLTVSGQVPVTGNGTYPLPRLTPPRYGYYVWGAILPADANNTSATSCAGTVLAQVAPSLTATPTDPRYRAGAIIRGQITVAGLPTPYTGTARLRLYGPFNRATDVACSGPLITDQRVTVNANGTVAGPEIKVSRFGYYLWAADLPASTFSVATTTSCSASGSVFQVTW